MRARSLNVTCPPTARNETRETARERACCAYHSFHIERRAAPDPPHTPPHAVRTCPGRYGMPSPPPMLTKSKTAPVAACTSATASSSTPTCAAAVSQWAGVRGVATHARKPRCYTQHTAATRRRLRYHAAVVFARPSARAPSALLACTPANAPPPPSTPARARTSPSSCACRSCGRRRVVACVAPCMACTAARHTGRGQR